MPKAALYHVASLCFALTTLTGCGGSNLPPLAKVHGIVTLDGKPLKTGSVMFYPDKNRGTSGRMAVGGIDQSGRFEITTLKPGDGAQIGHHLVAIQSYENTATQDPNSPTPIKSISLIPEQYADAGTSGLTAEVVKGKSNEVNFELKMSKK